MKQKPRTQTHTRTRKNLSPDATPVAELDAMPMAELDAMPMAEFIAHDLERRELEVSLIRPGKAARLLGISMTTLWRESKKHGFPTKYQLSPNAVVFRENELRAWVRQLPVVEREEKEPRP
jgi:predicted DNA-binding transcriptional regulator AlpA